MPDKSDKGAWAVIRYLPFDTSEGELPAHFDGWFTNRDGAEAIAKDWLVSTPKRPWPWWSSPIATWRLRRTTEPSRRGCGCSAGNRLRIS
jgi:hypothetical protein